MKKFYTKPTLCVDAFEMTEVICTSPVRNVEGGDLGYGGKSSNDQSGQGARANNRGIWDED